MILPSVGSSDAGRCPVGPIEPATKRDSPGRLAGDLGGAAVDLHRVVGQAPLLELEPRALEGVGLQDDRPRLEHGLVHALDDVGAIEHERLVALALQPAVVLLGQVELLQCRAHAAVEDDDAFANGG